MKLPKRLLRRLAVAFALGAGFFSMPAGQAQPAPQTGSGRILFIFNTSADMKKRLPAVRAEVNTLLATSLGGQLLPGDSIGVWTFDRDLRTGEFPLQRWTPEAAATIAAGINKFVGARRYANRTRFSALQPQLNQVIQNSDRLTVLIFCDGGDEIAGTPYDADINRVFQRRQAEQKRALQPFVLVLRTQLGQYVGSTMNFPPGRVSLPQFPPLPVPPAPTVPVNPPPAPTNAPTPAPVVQPAPTGPPLIIVGTNVESSLPPVPALVPPTNAVPAAPINPVAPAPTNTAPAFQTNTAPPPAISPAATNAAAPKPTVAPALPAKPAPAIQTNAATPQPAKVAPVMPEKIAPVRPTNLETPTNTVARPPETTGAEHTGALIVGVGLFIAAGALAALAFFRRRRPDRGSLITRSMRKD